MPYNSKGQRRWLALYEYQKLYPDETIIYDKPDFRKDIHTCKWCGKPLKNKRQSSYCCEECKHHFENCTVWGRGHSPLAYRILCRDKFICQRCGKFVGMINNYGMLIPTGVNAEVHHKIPVFNGGTDNQSNLVTLCSKCHCEIHGKEYTERANYVKNAVHYSNID